MCCYMLLLLLLKSERKVASLGQYKILFLLYIFIDCY